MSKLKNMIKQESTVWVEYPDIDGFVVHLRYLKREDLLKIRNSSVTYKLNRKTRQKEEHLDNDKFLEKYAEKAIIDWKGLKTKDLPKLIPVDVSGMNKAQLEEEIPYDPEDALEILKNSTAFDEFLTELMADYEEFLRSKAEDNAKN